MEPDFTQQEVERKINALGGISDTQRKEIICALIGHSRIVSTCFGYVYCGRCEAQIGDQLGGVYNASKNVIIGHKCEKCLANSTSLTWKDTFYTPDPFAEADIEAVAA